MIQEKKIKTDLQDGGRGGHIGFTFGTFVAIFHLQVNSGRYFLSSFESTGFSVQKFKIDFQDGVRGGHLGFAISMILGIFDVQVTLILPTKF